MISLFKSNEKCLLVGHHWLLFRKLHSLVIVSVYSCRWQFFFFFITKGLKIIAVTKFSLKEVKSLSVWPRLFQLQGDCGFSNVETGRADIVAVQCYQEDVNQLLKLMLCVEEEGGCSVSDLLGSLRRA